MQQPACSWGVGGLESGHLCCTLKQQIFLLGLRKQLNTRSATTWVGKWYASLCHSDDITCSSAAERLQSNFHGSLCGFDVILAFT